MIQKLDSAGKFIEDKLQQLDGCVKRYTYPYEEKVRSLWNYNYRDIAVTKRVANFFFEGHSDVNIISSGLKRDVLPKIRDLKRVFKDWTLAQYVSFKLRNLKAPAGKPSISILSVYDGVCVLLRDYPIEMACCIVGEIEHTLKVEFPKVVQKPEYNRIAYRRPNSRLYIECVPSGCQWVGEVEEKVETYTVKTDNRKLVCS